MQAEVAAGGKQLKDRGVRMGMGGDKGVKLVSPPVPYSG
jgi:hypothetical protein